MKRTLQAERVGGTATVPADAVCGSDARDSFFFLFLQQSRLSKYEYRLHKRCAVNRCYC